MKLSEKTLQEIIEEELDLATFDDFEKEIANLPVGKNEKLDNDQRSMLAKINYLYEKANDDYFDIDNITELSFFSIDFSTFARLGIAKGNAEKRVFKPSAVDYGKDYSDIHLFVQNVFDSGIYAVYLKDYSFGYIKPFGECVYLLEDDYREIENEMEHALTAKEGVLFVLLPYLAKEIHDGNINLDEELYSYYHDIPTTQIPGQEEAFDHELITVQQAASILGVCDSRVKKMVSDRVVDGFKRNGKVWLSKAEIQERAENIARYGKPTRGKAKK